MRCQRCKRHAAVWRTGSDGFAARTGAKVCGGWSCMQWASGGYPVSFFRIEKKGSSK